MKNNLQKLPFKTFLKTFKFVPRVAVNLLVKNSSKQILLTKRAKPPFAGYWHIPGSFLLKGEKLADCIERVAREELGIKLEKEKVKLLGVFEDLDKDERGHIIDVIYCYQLTENNLSLKPIGDTKAIEFFSKLPSNIGFNHKEYLNNMK